MVHIRLIIALFCVSLFSYSQVRIEKNVTAKYLSQEISNDTLKLASTHSIDKIEIFNKSYKIIYYPEKEKDSLSLKCIPNGSYTVSVYTDKKIIVLKLFKDEEISN